MVPEGFSVVLVTKVRHFVEDHAVKPFGLEYQEHRREVDDIVEGALSQDVFSQFFDYYSFACLVHPLFFQPITDSLRQYNLCLLGNYVADVNPEPRLDSMA